MPEPLSPATAAFGARVRTRRHELGLSQEALADLSGLHWTFLGQVERGRRNLSLHNVLKVRSEEHTSELQSQSNLVCRLLLEKKKKTNNDHSTQQRHYIYQKISLNSSQTKSTLLYRRKSTTLSNSSSTLLFQSSRNHVPYVST